MVNGMSYFSQFTGGPSKITTYTSGSGTYTPISTTQSWARVTVVAGGAGGGTSGTAQNAGSGGGAGATRIVWIKLSDASYAYLVGAGGGAGANGSASYFGTIVARPGIAGGDSLFPGNGGGISASSNGYPNGALGQSGGRGGNGGQAFAGTAGCAVAFPSFLVISGARNVYPAGRSTGGSVSSGYGGGGGGGDSAYGIGGNGGNGNGAGTGANGGNGSGYGAGGGAGGAGSVARGTAGSGSGGLIIIEEFLRP